jgi:hypothetical protein
MSKLLKGSYDRYRPGLDIDSLMSVFDVDDVSSLV